MTKLESAKDNKKWFFMHAIITAIVLYVITTAIFFSAFFVAATGVRCLNDLISSQRQVTGAKVRKCESVKGVKGSDKLQVRKCESVKGAKGANVNYGGVDSPGDILFFLSQTCGALPDPASLQVVNGDKLQVRKCESKDLSLSHLLPVTEFIPYAEFVVIEKAAHRNGCFDDDFLILLAIRKAENGRAGREFGVLDPKAINTNLDTQAGWAAATIVKNRTRWENGGCTALRGGDQPMTANASGGADEFITYLGKRYCPPKAHRLNRHWEKNVRFWYGRFKGLPQNIITMKDMKNTKKTKKV